MFEFHVAIEVINFLDLFRNFNPSSSFKSPTNRFDDNSTLQSLLLFTTIPFKSLIN